MIKKTTQKFLILTLLFVGSARAIEPTPFEDVVVEAVGGLEAEGVIGTIVTKATWVAAVILLPRAVFDLLLSDLDSLSFPEED
jgi:hypothetical protein